MSFASIIKRINSLPPLPQSVIKLERLFASGEPDIKELVEIIEEDPVLTADILAKVNAPIYSFSKRVVSVMQAVTLFGSAKLRGLVLKASFERNFEVDLSPYGISNQKFADISAMQSALMFQWYMGIDVARSKFMVPIAFLMETGKVVLAKEIVESSYAQQFYEILSQSESIEAAEEMFADITSAEINALLFEHWSFDELFIVLMEHLDSDEPIPAEYRDLVETLRVIRTAVNVKEQLSDESIVKAAMIVKNMGLDPVKFVNAAKRIRKKFNVGEI